MPLVTPKNESILPEDLQSKIQFFKGPLGVVPNSILTMAYHPNIAKAFTALNVAVMECHGEVSGELKRLIGYMTSATSGCKYCQAHSALGSKRFGATDERFSEIWNFRDSDKFSEAEKAAFEFAIAASSVPNAVDQAISERLHKHWSDEDIVEITGVIALFGYLNRWNDSMGTTLENLPAKTGKELLSCHGWDTGKHRG